MGMVKTSLLYLVVKQKRMCSFKFEILSVNKKHTFLLIKSKDI